MLTVEASLDQGLKLFFEPFFPIVLVPWSCLGGEERYPFYSLFSACEGQSVRELRKVRMVGRRDLKVGGAGCSHLSPTLPYSSRKNISEKHQMISIMAASAKCDVLPASGYPRFVRWPQWALLEL